MRLAMMGSSTAEKLAGIDSESPSQGWPSAFMKGPEHQWVRSLQWNEVDPGFVTLGAPGPKSVLDCPSSRYAGGASPRMASADVRVFAAPREDMPSLSIALACGYPDVSPAMGTNLLPGRPDSPFGAVSVPKGDEHGFLRFGAVSGQPGILAYGDARCLVRRGPEAWPHDPIVRWYVCPIYSPQWDLDTSTVSEHHLERKRTPDAAYTLLLQLAEYVKGVDDDWIDDDEEMPTAEAVSDVRTFLKKGPEGVPVPRADMPVDGELGVYWSDGSTFAQAMFGGKGTCYYYAERDVNGVVEDKAHGDDVDVASDWPRRLVDFLTRLSR